jgi:hypothetical protein
VAVNCRDVVETLREGGTTNIQTREHLATCPACASEERFWLEVRGALRQVPSPPPFLHSRIMASVRAEARAREERHPWFLAAWTRRWVLPSMTAAIIVMGEGYGVTALFTQVSDDLVVRYSEQEAFLMAKNATPLAASATALSAGSTGLRPEEAAQSGDNLPGSRAVGRGKSQSDESLAYAPDPVSPVGAGTQLEPAKPTGELAKGAPPEPFQMAQLEEETEPSRAYVAPAPRWDAPKVSQPATQLPSKKERDQKDDRGAYAPTAPSTLSTGSALEESKAKRESRAPRDAAAGARSNQATVPCRIWRDGREVDRFELPLDAAPAPDTRWAFRVNSSGQVTPAAGGGDSPGDPHAVWDKVAALHLPEGLYTLTR